MSNSVENYLTVEGSNQSVKAFFEQANTNQSLFDFHAFVPMPPDVFQDDLGTEEEQMYPGEQNWYEWSINWRLKIADWRLTAPTFAQRLGERDAGSLIREK